MNDQNGSISVNSRDLASKSFISSCPTDILLCIFEAAVQEGQKGFEQATRISHICRRFRSIAVETPTLWTYIECGMRKSDSAIQAFWHRMAERNKGLPVVISIHEIHFQDSWPLSYCDLDKFANIKELTFSFPDTSAISDLQDLNFTIPTGYIDKLRLNFHWNSSRYDWRWEALLGRFEQVKNLYLYNAPRLRVEIDVGDSVKPHTGSALSRIEDLDIMYTELWIPDPLQLEHLRRLKITGRNWSFDWLAQISCPKLTTLEIAGDTVVSNSMSFLAKHPSVTSLRLSSWENLEEIVTTAPQLQHLAFEHQGMIAHYHLLLRSKPEISLPVLRSLSTLDLEGSLQPHHFDEIVRGRCLPSTHSLSLLPRSLNPLENFTICSPLSYSPDRQLWRESGLFREASCRVERHEGDDPPHVQFILSWI